jgi:uncharacterized Ntn-hydrolase superfamily protein
VASYIEPVRIRFHPRFKRAAHVPALVVALSLIDPSIARATYSIVAADTASSEVGAAGTSCVGGALTIITIYGSAPGRGAVVAQARVNTAGRDEAERLLEQGTAPADIIAAITSATFDPSTFFGGAEQRQYAIADVLGRSAGFTGGQTLEYSDDIQGTVGAFTYSVQGNILTGAAVLDQARAAFEEPACDLAERLMKALEAGADNGEGDSRCTPDGIPSDGAFIEVDLPGDSAGSFLRLEENDSALDNPIVLLRAQFDSWRITHPCEAPAMPEAGPPANPTADAAAPAAGGVANTPGAGGMSGGSSTGGTSVASGGTVSAGGGSAGAPPAVGGASGSLGAEPSASEDDSGCGCRFRTERGGSAFLVFLLAMAGMSWRRRTAPDVHRVLS